jgi:sec-independent protein translocase protein TatC
MTVSDGVSAMPLLDHLRELRLRLIRSCAALLAGSMVGLSFSREAIQRLVAMCQACGEIQVVGPTEGIATYFRVALLIGLVFATPVILHEALAFVLPGLHRHERRYLLLMLPGAAVAFATGLAFGALVVLPRTINFLAAFLAGTAAANWTLGSYIAFVTNLLLVVGLTFETPLVVFLLAKLGILTPAFMAHYRRHAIVVMALGAAVLTPTPDPFTMFLVLIPMIVLYELGMILARFA